jgi:5-methylcytosine-specific restriction endonuclease McrA
VTFSSISQDRLSILVLFTAAIVLMAIWRRPISAHLRRPFCGRTQKPKIDYPPFQAKEPRKTNVRTRTRPKREQRRHDTPKRVVPYEKYLGSNEWSSIRRRVLARDSHRCQQCGATSVLQIHHLTYERRGRELLSELTVLCDNCHTRAHQRGLLGVSEEWQRRNQNRGH